MNRWVDGFVVVVLALAVVVLPPLPRHIQNIEDTLRNQKPPVIVIKNIDTTCSVTESFDKELGTLTIITVERIPEHGLPTD